MIPTTKRASNVAMSTTPILLFTVSNAPFVLSDRTKRKLIRFAKNIGHTAILLDLTRIRKQRHQN